MSILTIEEEKAIDLKELENMFLRIAFFPKYSNNELILIKINDVIKLLKEET